MELQQLIKNHIDNMKNVLIQALKVCVKTFLCTLFFIEAMLQQSFLIVASSCCNNTCKNS